MSTLHRVTTPSARGDRAQVSATTTKLWLVRADLGLGQCDQPLRTTREIIKAEPSAQEAYVLRATALMMLMDLDVAKKHLKAPRPPRVSQSLSGTQPLPRGLGSLGRAHQPMQGQAARRPRYTH